jgi:serine/threonine-protein kinase
MPLKSASALPPQMSDDPRVGKRLAGRYEIRRVVADGGMGRVYEGIDQEQKARIAVKVLHDDVGKDEIALERFRREYEISQKLPHDHIVDVRDFRRDDTLGIWFSVMEFLDGEELRFVLKRLGVLPPERLVRMLAQVAVGLDKAHALKFVHRDLKPDNIFLCGTREGDVVKLLDFGSVKDKNKDAKKLTQMGTTLGSPYYMAPEQAQGLDTLDARADVWALAAIAYECLTGTVPFEGNNGPSILLNIMTKDPTPPTVKVRERGLAALPPGLDDVIEEGLAKNPNIRIKTIGGLADAVGRAFGLAGTHADWATRSEDALREQLAASAAAAMAPRAAVFGSVADPFANPAAAGGAPGAVAPGGVDPNARAASRAMDQAFAQAREDGLGAAGVPAGVPGGAPRWLLSVALGGAVLLLGILAVVLVASR